MAFFRIGTHIEDGYITVRLNDICLPNDSSVLEIQIEPHTEYIVQWFVQGKKDSKYTISISSPREAEFQFLRTLGHSGKDFGGYRFTL